MINVIQLPLIFTVVGAGLLLYWFRHELSIAYHWMSSLIQRYSAMPTFSRGDVFVTIWRVIRLNWYSVLMVVVLWFILFNVDVGSDIVIHYVDHLLNNGFSSKFWSLWWLFGCLLLMTLAIWIIPFFLFSPKRFNRAKSDAVRFYMGTKFLSILAITPYYVVAGAFLFRNEPVELPLWYLPVFSLAGVAVFLLIEFKILHIHWVSRFLNSASDILVQWGGQYLGGNRYLIILIKILIVELIFILIVAGLINGYAADALVHIYVSVFVLVSSAFIFKLLFFTNDTKLTRKEVIAMVTAMTSADNIRHSRHFYYTVLFLLLFINAYFFVVPSLTTTNTIYVLLIVFALLIVYLDLCRNLASSEKIGIRITGFMGIFLFLLASVISPKGQFVVPLREYTSSSASASDSLGVDPKLNKPGYLEAALERRIAIIDQLDSTRNNNIYLVCAMGGGSRAGYFTAKVLQELEREIPGFWQRTLLYSTVSGGSVGVYHHIKGRYIVSYSRFLNHIYEQNYNSSAVYGLLLGDAFEGLFGGWIRKIGSIINNKDSAVLYRDRNVRIREEYDYAMNAALAGEKSDGYTTNTFRPGIDISRHDAFKGFFADHVDTIPVHFVNTFEINTGRRTVLSPFIVGKDSIFPNAILPLQDTIFSPRIIHEDITYREAVNLSELFPFLSAASTIGKKSNHQFVDGGYFENYGLATAFDVATYLIDNQKVAKDRIKIILIKNSLQESNVEKQSWQLIAPLIGAVNAPFTGHANHFLKEGQNRFGGNMVELKFDSDDKETKVPLTRALARRHLKTMDSIAIHVVKQNVESINR